MQLSRDEFKFRAPVDNENKMPEREEQNVMRSLILAGNKARLPAEKSCLISSDVEPIFS